MSIGRMLRRVLMPGLAAVEVEPGWIESDIDYRRRIRRQADAIAMRSLLANGEPLDALGARVGLPRGRSTKPRAF